MTSKINLAVESVIDLINGLNNFATMTRGALGTSAGLSCEIAPSMPSETYMDKNDYTPITLALNGKHTNLKTVTDAMNDIADTLSRMTAYPSGNGWEIVDISKGSISRVIGRDEKNLWLIACDLIVKLYRKDDE